MTGSPNRPDQSPFDGPETMGGKLDSHGADEPLNGQKTAYSGPLFELLSLGAAFMGFVQYQTPEGSRWAGITSGKKEMDRFPGRYQDEPSAYKGAFVTDPEEITALMEGRGDKAGRAKGQRVERFNYEPGRAGFVCLDLDRGHGSGEDGVKAFLDLLKKPGKPLPSYFADLDGGSFPCYVTTPSGGLHLYFRFKGARTFRRRVLTKGAESFHFGGMLTAPGSQKNGVPYVLHGSLSKAPPLPPIVENLMGDTKEAQGRGLPSIASYKAEEEGQVPLQVIADTVVRQGRWAGPNDVCFFTACWAGREGYSAEEVESFLRGFSLTANHDQIKTTVHSGIKRGKS